MGFAVVADEVRSLAQRSAQAAKETATKIEAANQKTGEGVRLTQKVATSLGEIVTMVRQVDTLAAGSATASREQHEGLRQISTSISAMDRVVQSNAAAAEEGSAAAEELNAQASAMLATVGDLNALVGLRGMPITTRPAKASEGTPHVRNALGAPKAGSRTKRPAPAAMRAARPRAIMSGYNAAEGQFAEISS